MFVTRARRSSPMARLRRTAMAWAPAPLRTCERSSSKVTSLTQCKRFSIPQWPRLRARSLLGVAFVALRLVIPKTTSWRMGVPSSFVVVRSIRKTCWEYGKSRYVARSALAHSWRTSNRPCPLLTVVA